MCTATSLENPCTAEALESGQFYHANALDSHSYVQCDESGFPHIRPCPPSLVWSAAELTCVRKSATVMSAMKPGGKARWKFMTSGSSHQQQQQQNHGSNQQQSSSANGWQPSAAARNPWSFNMGSRMDNVQQWMVRCRPHYKNSICAFTR